MPSWGDLNKRQQTYLQAVYEVDQAQEANIKLGALEGDGRARLPQNGGGCPTTHQALRSYAAFKRRATAMRELAQPLPRWSVVAWSSASMNLPPWAGLSSSYRSPKRAASWYVRCWVSKRRKRYPLACSASGTGAPSAVPMFAASRAWAMIARRRMDSAM
jgi:hypothetical protein